MDLSIIIVNYNQKNFLQECLKNIKEAQIKLPYEIIVVDNASMDKSLTLLSNFQFPISNFQIITNSKNLGFAGGCNKGIKKSSGKYILILNPDIVVLPDSVEKLIDFINSHPDCGICGPKLINPDGTIQDSCRRFPQWCTPWIRRTFLRYLPCGKKHDKYYLMKDFDHQENRPVDWLMGAVLIVRRQALEEVGLMDERYFLYFEDTDWCRTFWQKNLKVYYVAEVKMYHYHQRLSASQGFIKGLFSKITWIHFLSAIKYFWKWR